MLETPSHGALGASYFFFSTQKIHSTQTVEKKQESMDKNDFIQQ